MRLPFRPHAVLRLAALSFATALAAACTASGPPQSATASPSASPMTITVNGKNRSVAEDSTLGEAMQQLGLRARPGRLLDVEGNVLEAREYPPVFQVNGENATRSTLLRVGDNVHLENGPDKVEDTKREKKKLEGTQPRNPQTVLGTSPGVEITTVGKISGAVESVVFRPTGKKDVPQTVALTFDDGPWPTYTKQILRILKKHHVPATFFVVGYLAERHPGLVRQEIRQGHTVGNHSWNHPINPPFRELDEKKQDQQMTRTNTVLEDAGVKPFLFRPPGGSYDGGVIEKARRYGMRVVLWSVSSNDWENDVTKDQIVKRVLSNVGPGSIVLMHDGGGDQHATVNALPEIIKGIRKKGLELVAIDRET